MSAPFTPEDTAWARRKWPEPMTRPPELVKWYKELKKAHPGIEPTFVKLEAPRLEERDVIEKIDGEETKVKKIFSHGKNPAKGSTWMTCGISEAFDHMVEGGNVGIVATKENHIVLLDVDYPDKIQGIKQTMTVASRKRLGRHYTYVCNDPTGTEYTASINRSVGDGNEWASLRCNNSYVVAPGSFVYLTKEEYEAIPEGDRENAGYYTIINNVAPASITYPELPEIFREAIEADKKRASEIKLQAKPYEGKTDGKKSAIFDITPEDLYGSPGGNFPIPPAFHDSSTGMNCSISGELLTCWRHGCTHSGYSCLAVEAGLINCEDGTPFHSSGSGLKYDGEEEFKVWRYAKEKGIIPLDDPIPWKATGYYAVEKGIITSADIGKDGRVREGVYRKVLKALGEEGLLPEYRVYRKVLKALDEEGLLPEYMGTKKEKKQREQIPALFGDKYEGIVCPNGYQVEPSGTYMISVSINEEGEAEVSKTKISSTAFAITAMGKNIDTGDVFVRITYMTKDKHIRDEIIPVKDALCKASVTELMRKGILFTDRQANLINSYILGCIEDNDNLPKIAMVDSNGWKKTPNGDVFVCGSVGYWADDEVDVLPSSNKHDRGLGSHGELSKWVEGVGPALEKYQLLRFKLYTVLAAPLLRILGVQSFIQDHYGESGTGKSSSADIAMSAWGDPDKLRFNGDTTKTAAEYSAAMMCDIALFMDETGTQGKQEALSALVYMIANEQGRMRGKKDGGLREIASWKTIAMTTGEKPIVDSSGFTGQQVRVMPITSSLTPNGELSRDIANAVETIRSHNGHIGPLMIRKIFENMDRSKTLLKETEKIWQKVSSVTEHRMMRQYATLYVAGVLFEEIAEEIGLEKRDPEEIVLRYMKEAQATTTIEEYAIRGLRVILDWIQREERKFVDIPKRKREKMRLEEELKELHKDKFDPKMCKLEPIDHEVLGFVYTNRIDVVRNCLKEMLDKNGLSLQRIAKELIDLGVMEADTGRLDRKIAQIEDVKVDRVYRFKMNRINELLNKTGEQEEEWERVVVC